MIVRDAHQSGFHGASQAQWEAMLEQMPSVGLTTESVGFEMPDGWDSCGHETRVVFRADRWTAEKHGQVPIKTPEWTRGKSKRSSVEIQWALLRNLREGVSLLRFGGHLPAHLFKPSQERANQAALNGLAGVVKPLIIEHAPDVTTGSFDFNRNLKRASQRRVIREAIAGTGLHLVVPPKATHDVRTIDGFLTTGDLAASKMLDRTKGFDHRGVSLDAAACPHL